MRQANEYSYELSPDDLVVGGYNVYIRDGTGDTIVQSFFVADSWDKAEEIAEKGFNDWVIHDVAVS